MHSTGDDAVVESVRESRSSDNGSIPECEQYSSNNSNAPESCNSDNNIVSVCGSYSANNSIPELTSGTETDSDMRVFDLYSETDSGHSDVQWGNPMGNIPMGLNMQVSVGISNSSEFDTTELWSISANSESQHSSDDGISMGMIVEVSGEQVGVNERAELELVGYRDDVMLEMQRGAVLDILDDALVGAVGVNLDSDVGRRVDLLHNDDDGNGSVPSGDIRDGGAQMSPSFSYEDDTYALESVGSLNEFQGNGVSSNGGSRIQIRPIDGTESNEGLNSTYNSENGQ